jgi:predicted dehydrogenase
LGEIGSIRLFRSQFGFPPLQPSNFRYDPVIGGGSLLDAGAYTVKASQMFFGTGAEVLSSVLYVDPVRSTDLYGSVSLLTKAGIVCQLSFGFDNAYQCNYEFWGSAGRIISEKAFTPKSEEFPPVRVSVNGSAFDQLLLDPDNHFEGILKSFYTALQTRSFESHHLDILDQARILDTIRTSAVKINYEGSNNRG